MTRVLKFGGALLKDAAGIRQTAQLIRNFKDNPLVIVVSAIGKTTNALENLLQNKLDGDLDQVERSLVDIRVQHFELAEAVFGNARHDIYDKLDDLFTQLNHVLKNDFPDRYFAYDQVVGFGELLSSTIVAQYLNDEGIETVWIDARELIMTDSNYTSASVDWKLTSEAVLEKTKPLLNKGKTVLVQGFTGADKVGNPTTLGREGSDFTAAILANILDADEVTIWKDVPGIMDADPKLFEEASKLRNISYHEAIELAFYGARVIHPKTIQPVREKNIPLYVRSFYDPDSIPTRISDDSSEDDSHHKIIIKDDQVLCSIASRELSFIAEENLTHIFEVFSRHRIHINMMQHSAVSFSVCFDEDEAKLKGLLHDLGKQFAVKYNRGLRLLTIRFYTDELIDRLSKGKKIFLEQRSRSTLQVLLK